MKDVILLAIGLVSGVLVTIAFGAKVQAAIFGLLTKAAMKIGPKN